MLKSTTYDLLEHYYRHRCELQDVAEQINYIVGLLAETFQNGKKLLICGNGGSAADADHIVGELVKAFKKHRAIEPTTAQKLRQNLKYGELLVDKLQGGLPAINLSAHSALLTAMINDVGGEFIYAQQVMAYGQPGDLLLGISTSGNATNILYAATVAKAKGMYTIGLTGMKGGEMLKQFDHIIRVSSEVTEDIQDIHSMVYHAICAGVEEELW